MGGKAATAGSDDASTSELFPEIHFWNLFGQVALCYPPSNPTVSPLVNLFVPCYVDQLYPEVGLATLTVLRRAGCKVRFDPRQTCCGQPMHTAGFAREALGAARRHLAIFRGSVTVCPAGSCVSFLRLGGRPLSGAIQWRFGPTATGAQVTYDATDARFSPGTVLKSLCIERAAREGLTTFELQARFLESKRRWTPLVHANACLTVVQLRTIRHKLVFPGTWLRSLSLRRRAAPRPAGAER